MEISRNCTRILSDARAVASASVPAPVFYGNFAKIQWRPTLHNPTVRASKAHRPTPTLCYVIFPIGFCTAFLSLDFPCFAVDFVAVVAFRLIGIAPFSSSRVIRVALAGSLDKAQKTRRTINNRAEYLSESRLGLPCSSPCPARSRSGSARAAFLCS